MFISGQFYNFESRLHKFPVISGDLATGFLIEGGSYHNLNKNVYYHWNKEYKRKYFNINRTPETGYPFL